MILLTNSPYLVQSLNNYIKWGALTKNHGHQRRVVSLGQLMKLDATLDVDNFTAYTISEIEVKPAISKRVGLIDESMFVGVFDDINRIYEKMRSVEWNLEH